VLSTCWETFPQSLFQLTRRALMARMREDSLLMRSLCPGEVRDHAVGEKRRRFREGAALFPCSENIEASEEIAELKPQVHDWRIVERDGIPRLERVFRLKDFAHALDFTNKVGAVAEEESHHLALLTQWGSVTVTWCKRCLHRSLGLTSCSITRHACHAHNVRPGVECSGYRSVQRSSHLAQATRKRCCAISDEDGCAWAWRSLSEYAAWLDRTFSRVHWSPDAELERTVKPC